MLTTVLLYGPLRKQFGKRWELDVETPAEAIRALCSQARGFKRHLIENSKPGYHVLVDDHDIGSPEHLAIGGARTIKIIPVVQGGKNAIWTIIIGVALVAFSMGMAGVFAAGTIGAMGVAAAGSIGISLILGGIAQLLFAPPTVAGKNQDEGTPNYSFSGPVNTAAQGHPVAVCYGRLRVGSAVISASFHTTQYASEPGPDGDQPDPEVPNPYSWVSGPIALSAVGGTGPYTWSLVHDPNSMFEVSGTDLVVVGTPGTSTQYATLKVEDANGASVEKTIEINCNGAPPSTSAFYQQPMLRRV